MRKLVIMFAMTFAPSIIPALAMAQTSLDSSSSSQSMGEASSSSGNEVGSSQSVSQGGQAGATAIINYTYNDPPAAAPADPAGANGTNGATGATGADPAGANGTNGTSASDPPALGSAANPATSTQNIHYSSDPATTNQNIHYSGSQTIKNVPDMATLIETPTAPCMVPVGATFSVAGFGGGAQSAYTSADCVKLEIIRMTWNMNQHDVASEMLCQFPSYRDARAIMGQPCPADPPVTNVAMPAAAASAVNTSATAPQRAGVVAAAVMTQHPTPPPPVSPLQQFCQTLDPNNPEDAPYYAYECDRSKD